MPDKINKKEKKKNTRRSKNYHKYPHFSKMYYLKSEDYNCTTIQQVVKLCNLLYKWIKHNIVLPFFSINNLCIYLYFFSFIATELSGEKLFFG